MLSNPGILDGQDIIKYKARAFCIHIWSAIYIYMVIGVIEIKLFHMELNCHDPTSRRTTCGIGGAR